MRHTREPWARDGDEVWADNDCEHHPVATAHHGNGCRSEQEAIGNARRIVACVNACAGIPNEQLECDNLEFIRIFNEHNMLKKQRDELRAALEFYAEGHHFILHDANAWETVSGEPQNFQEDEANTATVEDGSIARAAIASVKGGAE